MTLTKIGYAIQLRCLSQHLFNLVVERESDLEESYLLDANTNVDLGYVVYRDRSFVHCPYCNGYCHFTGVKAKMEIKYTPPKDAVQ